MATIVELLSHVDGIEYEDLFAQTFRRSYTRFENYIQKSITGKTQSNLISI